MTGLRSNRGTHLAFSLLGLTPFNIHAELGFHRSRNLSVRHSGLIDLANIDRGNRLINRSKASPKIAIFSENNSLASNTFGTGENRVVIQFSVIGNTRAAEIGRRRENLSGIIDA